MYPVRYAADYTEERNRWRTFFRFILALPWYLIESIYAFGAFIVAFIAWFALLFTGRYPEGLYNFNLGYLRYSARYNGWLNLQTEEWPPFGLGPEPGYPIRAEIDPPQESYNRWKVLFRLILGIPVMFVGAIMGYLQLSAAAINWLHIVFRKRASGGIHNALTVALTYRLRASAYFLLMTETLPPVSDQAPTPSLSERAGAAVSTPTRTPEQA